MDRRGQHSRMERVTELLDKAKANLWRSQLSVPESSHRLQAIKLGAAQVDLQEGDSKLPILLESFASQRCSYIHAWLIHLQASDSQTWLHAWPARLKKKSVCFERGREWFSDLAMPGARIASQPQHRAPSQSKGGEASKLQQAGKNKGPSSKPTSKVSLADFLNTSR